MNDLTNIEIPTENFIAFRKKVFSLNKKLEKRGLAPISIDNIRSGIMKIKTEHGNTFHVDSLIFDIKGEYPLIEGYDFVAFIDHTENMILSENHEVDVEPFRYRQTCDHCGSRRKRSKTYILQNKETGELVQIGSTCITAFLGVYGESLQEIVSAFTTLIFTKEKYENPESSKCGSYTLMVPSCEVINVAAKLIRDFGFVPSGDDDSTKELTKIWFFGSEHARQMNFPEGYDFKNLEDVYENVEKFVATAEDSPFIRNCQQIVENGYVSMKYFGYVAGMVQSWNKSMNTKKETDHNEFSFIPVGEKVKETAVYKGYRCFEGYYGLTYLHTFENEDHCFVWFTSKALDATEGETYTVTATVKENKEYKGTKQTVITRAKVA